MKLLFYENFITNLCNNGFFKINSSDNIFVKNFEGITYYVFPIIDTQNKKYIEEVTKSYYNLATSNSNRIVFLRLFISNDLFESFFNDFSDKFDIYSNALFIDWAFDLNKNKILVRKEHISKILNLEKLVTESIHTNKISTKEPLTPIYTTNNKIFLTFSIILVNIVMYIYINIFNKNQFNILVNNLAISKDIFSNNEFYRLFTSMFMHADFLHLSSNILSLYIFGSLVERYIGKIDFIICYFIGGIIGGTLSCIYNTNLSIGASGAIFALGGSLVCFYLRKRNTLNNLNLYPLILLIIVNIVTGYLSPRVDNIGHIGGFLSGVILSLIIYKVKKMINSLRI